MTPVRFEDEAFIGASVAVQYGDKRTEGFVVSIGPDFTVVSLDGQTVRVFNDGTGFVHGNVVEIEGKQVV